MRTLVSNYAGKVKLKYADIKDPILNEEICRKDFGEPFTFDSALNIEARGIN